MNIAIERVTAPSEEVRQLVEELSELLAAGYTAEQRHGLAFEQLFEPHILFFLARADGAAAACGGVALLDGYAELKRMYSRPAVRGRGVGKALLLRLEAEGRNRDVALLRLETGSYQEEAMRFYEHAGFRRCAAFGPYAAMPPSAIVTSVFYEKPL
jgi:putative acetyltransferase